MADFAHSLPRRTPSSSKITNVNDLTENNVYQDVFGGGSKFGIPSFSSVDDYSEVFSSYSSSRACSIPFLDLPLVDETDDVLSSELDYSEIFSGVDSVDYAISYDELFLEPKATAGESSSEEVWTPAETGSPSEESSEDPVCSESNQAFSNVESDFSYDNVNQFKVSYHMSNQMSKEDGISGTTHIAELNAVPAYTFVVDENLPLQTAKCDNPLLEKSKDHSQNADITDWQMDGEHYRGTEPPQPACGNDQKPQKALDVNGSCNEKKPFLTVTEISLRTQPSEVPPPARPPPKFTIKQGVGPGRKYSVNYAHHGAASVSSPPFLDVEVDASSSAAASAAAMKEAMEQAEARLKTAKELMERKKDGLQHRKKMGMKEDSKGNETRGGGIAHDPARVKEEMFHVKLERKDGNVEEFNKEEKQKGVEVAQVDPELEVKPRLFNISKEPVDHKHSKERKLIEESQWEEVIGEWKAEEQFFELVKKDTGGTTMVFPQHKKSERNFTPTTRVYEQGQCGKKGEKMGFVQQDRSDETLQADKGVSEVKEDTNRLKASQEAYEKAEHDNTVKAAPKICRREEHEKKLKETHEQEKKEAYKQEGYGKKLKQAHDQEGHENKLRESHARLENENKKKEILQREECERKQREIYQREENEKKQKETCEREENKRRQKETLEKEESERRMNEKKEKEAHEREENERKQKEARAKEDDERRIDEKKQEEAREREENERRQKEAHEKEENQRRINEKKQEEARKREENERRQKEAREKEENEKRINELKQKAAREREENERREKEAREKREKEAREKEENEKRLKEFHAMQTNERKLKLDAEESERRLKEVHEREENQRRQKEESEREENEKRLKESCEREENDRRAKQAAEENEKKLKEPCEEVTKKLLQKATHEGVETEEKRRELEERCESETSPDESSELGKSNKKLNEESNLEEIKKGCNEAFKREENDQHELSQDFQISCEEDKKLRAEIVIEEITKCEKNLKAGIYTRMQDETENSRASGGGCEQEEINKELKMAQESCGNVESEKVMNTAQNAFENSGNVKNFEEDEKSCQKDEYERSRSGPMTQSFSRQEDYKDNQIAAEKVNVDDSEKKSGNIEDVVRQENDEKCTKEETVVLNCQDRRKNIKASQRVGQYIEDEMKVQVAQTINEEKITKPKLVDEFKTNQERKETYPNGNFARDGSGKEGRTGKEKEQERERLRKLEEDRQREREKDRMAVERVTREARERAYTEARERAERAAVERATAEARQRAMAEARERLEKACAEAREKSLAEKAYSEARLRAERAAVERATTEARERAVEKAMAERAAMEARERVERSFSEKFSATSRDGGLRHAASFSDLRDAQFQSSSSFSSSQRYPNSSNHGAFTTEKSQGIEVDSAQRCKAKLERHQRTVERAAKALAEKNLRDHLAQREQAERNRLAESLDADVKRWSSGKEGNLRALLSTLQYILGSDSGWQPVPLTEVITAAAAKKAYRKATLCVHPDKLQQRGASIQQKYICEKVFDLLKDAWNKFNSEER